MPFQCLRSRLNQPHINIDRVEEAFLFAKKAHEGQKRKSGEDYIFHPLEVAMYLTEYYADEDTIIAALLHDTVEDTDNTLEDIEKHFGKGVAQLTDGVTKFEKEAFAGVENVDIKLESLRKWFEVMQQDIRVAVIKLVDRLHNMETLEGHQDEEKKRLIAKETLDVYVKIAFRLGINKLKEKLEEEALKYIDPKSYAILTDIQEKEFDLAKEKLTEVRSVLESIDQKKIITRVTPQAPSLMKMHEKEVQLKEEIKGVLPLIYIINVDKEEDCYKTLYYIHKRWKVEQGGFEDYINTPDPGGYRALHTRVIYEDGRHILFKIRTHEMERYSKYGITLYCFSEREDSHQQLYWLKELSLITGGSKDQSQTFWDQLQHDVLEAPIVIHTARHDTLLLPANSTILDAAFYSYAQKAWHIEKIYLNGVKVPLYTPLKHNDRIHCYFQDEINIRYEWLGYVDTALASSYMREGLQALDEKKKIQLGEEVLSIELEKKGKGFIEELDDKATAPFFEKYKIKSLKQLYKKIAEGEIIPSEVIKNIYKKEFKTEIKPTEKKFLNIKGSFLELSKFIDRFSEIFQKGTYSISKKANRSELSFKSSKMKDSTWENIITNAERNPELEIIKEGSCQKRTKLIFAFILISLLWGLDPVIAYQLIQETQVSPMAFTTIRFWSVAIFSAIILDFHSNVLQRGDSKIPVKKYLSPFKIEFLLIAFCLFATAFSSYMALSNGTDPFSYILALGIYMGLFLTFKITKKLFQTALLRFLIIYTLLFVGFGVLFWQSSWSLTGKIWTASLVFFFSAYSFLNDHYKQKLKIFSRSSLLQLYLTIYGSIFSLILFFLLPWPELVFNDYLKLIIYSSIFTGIPYLIYFYIMREAKSMALIGYQLSIVLLVGFFADLYIEKDIHFISTVSFILILSGLTLLNKSISSQEKRERI